MTDDNPQIMPKENGSLVVSGPVTFKMPDGSRETAEKEFLCRCGASRNKPYCDGSHRGIEFSSETGNSPPRDHLFKYEGRDVTVYFSKHLCSHAAECGKRLISVFDPSKKPWVQPDNGTVADIEAVARACPSGAIQTSAPGADPVHSTGADPVITVEKNGPYRVENVELANADWSENASPQKYVLCRCGQSKNKPFCDGTHRDVKWSDEG